ncbi:hypothetical protein BH23ACT9_BH23ACT9_16310 [soil metagenome]
MAKPPDLNDDELHAELESLGFRAVQADRKGVVQYARQPNRFLIEWVHDDGAELLFTWEFDLGEFCESVGWHLASGDTSLQILYPRYDIKIARDLEAVAIEVQRLEDQMRGLDLSDPSL